MTWDITPENGCKKAFEWICRETVQMKICEILMICPKLFSTNRFSFINKRYRYCCICIRPFWKALTDYIIGKSKWEWSNGCYGLLSLDSINLKEEITSSNYNSHKGSDILIALDDWFPRNIINHKINSLNYILQRLYQYTFYSFKS